MTIECVCVFVCVSPGPDLDRVIQIKNQTGQVNDE